MATTHPISTAEASKQMGGGDRIKRAAHDFPPVTTTATSTLAPIFDTPGGEAAWIVRGFFTVIPYVFSLPCTMTVYRACNGEITLVNALRVSADLEDKILSLGRVANVVKLGQFHGVADAYWCLHEKFGRPQYWTLPGGTVAEGFKADAILAKDNLPIPGAILYQMEGHPFPEAVMTVPLGAKGPMLIACDAIVHLTETEGMPIISRLVMNLFGLLCTPGIPQPAALWSRKSIQFVGLERMKAWFDDVFQLEWRAIVGAHGVHVLDCDRDAARAAAYRRIGVQLES